MLKCVRKSIVTTLICSMVWSSIGFLAFSAQPVYAAEPTSSTEQTQSVESTEEIPPIGPTEQVPPVEPTEQVPPVEKELPIEPVAPAMTRVIDTKAIYKAQPFFKAVNEGILAIHELHPSTTELRKIGTSVDGNPIMGIKVGKGEEQVLVFAAMHGRETLTSVLLLNQIEDLVLAYEGDAKIQDGCGVDTDIAVKCAKKYRSWGYLPKQVLDDVSIWFVPLLNPDGAELAMNGTSYIKDKDKLSVVKSPEILPSWKANLNGVDLNRNYNLKAPVRGTYPDRAYYSGPSAYSEPETKAIMNFTTAENFAAVINYHSQGELVYYDAPFKSLASKLIKATGYAPVGSNGTDNTMPTYDTWYYNKFKRPVFTIEIGKGDYGKPLNYAQYQKIWNQNWRTPMILAAERQQQMLSAMLSKDSDLLWLVNRSHPIAKTYAPKNRKAPRGSAQKLQSEAATAFDKMKDGVAAAGYGTISCKSGYRTYATQTSLFQGRMKARQKDGMSYANAYEGTARFTAIPGTSEHQTGLAADITNTGTLTADFGKTKAGIWLKENSWRYGYILRYTEEKSVVTRIGDEPWHFRYVGLPHSQIIYEHDFCYEEYIDALKAGQKFEVSRQDGMVYQVFRTVGKNVLYSNVIGYCRDNAGGYIVTRLIPKEKPVEPPVEKKEPITDMFAYCSENE